MTASNPRPAMQPTAEPPAYALDTSSSTQPLDAASELVTTEVEALPTYSAAVKTQQPLARPAMTLVAPAEGEQPREWDAHLCGCCDNSAAVKTCMLAACCPSTRYRTPS